MNNPASKRKRSLSEHLPGFMCEIKEIACIMKTLDEEFELLRAAVEKGLDNTFVNHADAQGLARFRKLFSVGSAGEIKAKLLEKPPYTYNSLNSALSELYGEDWNSGNPVDVDYADSKVTVFLNLSTEEHIQVIEKLLRWRIPANMTIETVFVFNRYKDLTFFTYDELNARTYLKIKRGEF